MLWSKMVNRVIDSEYAFIKDNQYERVLSKNDLFQEGFLGLLKALKKYDSNKSSFFYCYAYYYIKRDIQKALVKHGLGAVSLSYYIRMWKIKIDKQCKRTGLTYRDLYDSKEITLEQYFILVNTFGSPVTHLIPEIEKEEDNDYCDLIVNVKNNLFPIIKNNFSNKTRTRNYIIAEALIDQALMIGKFNCSSIARKYKVFQSDVFAVKKVIVKNLRLVLKIHVV